MAGLMTAAWPELDVQNQQLTHLRQTEVQDDWQAMGRKPLGLPVAG